ncbi:MAG: hypothetical protein C4324_03645 [Blastocatellia bacterium]
MDIAELTNRPISVGDVARRFVPEDCGATVTLDGYARRFTRNLANGEIRQTQYLVYEAYEQMALKEMKKMIARAKTAFRISAVAVIHRLGRVEIGETSVVVSVAAPHRHEAFAACSWLIGELKRTVPIWKKEVYSDGEAWAEPSSSLGTQP